MHGIIWHIMTRPGPRVDLPLDPEGAESVAIEVMETTEGGARLYLLSRLLDVAKPVRRALGHDALLVFAEFGRLMIRPWEPDGQTVLAYWRESTERLSEGDASAENSLRNLALHFARMRLPLNGKITLTDKIRLHLEYPLDSDEIQLLGIAFPNRLEIWNFSYHRNQHNKVSVNEWLR